MSSPPLAGSNPPDESAGLRSQDLFENAPVGLCEVDATGLVIAINQTLLDWVGYARADVVDRRGVEALVSPESATTVQALIERCCHAEQVAGVILMWRGADGQQYWPGEVTATAVYDTEGKCIGWRGCVRVMPQTMGEMERLLQQRTLEAIERFASGVAHKFNNLLQVIQGYAELGLITIESSHPVHGNLARIKEAAQRAAALVQGLVAFSRRQTMRRRPIDLNLFMTQLGSRLRRIVPASVELNMMPAHEQVRILADTSGLEQVLVHLVINSCEAMPQGGTLTIETRLVQPSTEGVPADLPPQDYACVTVSDTGSGIESEVVGQIFEPFFTTKDSSNGLGLAVAWGVVRQHEGRIEVTTRPGLGTTMRIYLPAERVASG